MYRLTLVNIRGVVGAVDVCTGAEVSHVCTLAAESKLFVVALIEPVESYVTELED